MTPDKRLFGTDGIRAVAGTPPLVREVVAPLARELGRTLRERAAAAGGEVPLVVLGGDTRASTPEITAWVADGLAAAGVPCENAGVVPTPAVAWLVRAEHGVAGVAISASHNPAADNGVKLIDAGGFKWSDADEAALERRLAAAAAEPVPVGTAPPAIAALGARYLDALAASLPGERPLAGLRVVLDTANGATSPYAGALFARLGADVEVLHDRPDGSNINRDCGSTHPDGLAARVVAAGADFGVAFDGDGDRAILVDERGEIRDGDAILYLWARALRDAGALSPAAVVATSMSNLGLEVALRRDGIAVERCDVGDRAVVETMKRHGIALGGEQSGHVVHLGLSSTGDGMLTALQLAAVVARGLRQGRPLSQQLAGFARFPQLLRNVRVGRKLPFAELPRTTAAARAVEARLGADGRLVLRYSGTEPLARIMIEGPEQATIEAMAEELATVLHDELGAAPRA